MAETKELSIRVEESGVTTYASPSPPSKDGNGGGGGGCCCVGCVTCTNSSKDD